MDNETYGACSTENRRSAAEETWRAGTIWGGRLPTFGNARPPPDSASILSLGDNRGTSVATGAVAATGDDNFNEGTAFGFSKEGKSCETFAVTSCGETSRGRSTGLKQQ